MPFVPRKKFIPEEEDRAYAANLKQTRESQGINVRDLAAAVGVGPTTISRYENLARGIPSQQLRKLEKVLGRGSVTGEIAAPAATSEARAMPPASTEHGGIIVRTSEGLSVGIRLDGIKDDKLRAEAEYACHEALRSVLDPRASRVGPPGHSRRQRK